jgi:hypothetical protein
MADEPVTLATIPCCPELARDDACEVIDFRYRLLHRGHVRDQRIDVPVEVTLVFRLERCPGPLVLGDPVYSTTLLPGEKVRLFTTDRRTRFTFDSETQLAYRSEQASEEHVYMASMADFMSDLTVRDEATSTNRASGHTQGHGDASGAIESLFAGPSVDVSGSFDAQATSAFANELHSHARASDRRSTTAARTSSAVSVGEVATRAHASGSSEDHFESASREFANPNRCHAVTFLFYRINKRQTVRFTLEAIERRVEDPAGSTKAVNNGFLNRGGVAAVPDGVRATAKDRLEVEARGRQAVLAERQPELQRLQAGGAAKAGLAAAPLPAAVREAALRHVEDDLVEAGLLAKGGAVAEAFRRTVSFERTSSLPTPGVIVKGCLDDCDICEPMLERRIELELKLLERQIELLDRSQEYRCCPGDEDPPPEG